MQRKINLATVIVVFLAFFFSSSSLIAYNTKSYSVFYKKPIEKNDRTTLKNIPEVSPKENSEKEIKTDSLRVSEKKDTLKISDEIENTNLIKPVYPAFKESEVPFFSQFKDISSTKWQKIGCGVASLAMLIDYYKPGEVSVDNLLNEGINSGAYLTNQGWTHQGLASLADDHGLKGKPYDFSNMSMDNAFSQIKTALEKGPVIASVHYTFDPKNPIPHLVVINSIVGETVTYNDPADDSGGKKISATTFKSAWKKRYIAVLPSV